MTFVRYEPWTLVNRLRRELDPLCRDALASRPTAATASRAEAQIPLVDARTEADRYVVRAELPGIPPSDIEITTDQGVLTIRAERRAETRADASASTRPARLAASFVRRFTLPEDADATAIDAHSSHGVLELTIRKQPRPEPRRIVVQAA